MSTNVSSSVGPPWPDVRIDHVLGWMQRNRAAQPHDLSLEEQRIQGATAAAARVVPVDVAIEPAVVAGVSCEWLRPSAARFGTVVYFHGGGYVGGSLSDSRAPTAFLAHATRLSVLNVDYRLAPESPYPAAVADAVAVVSTLADAQGAARVVLVGESAGGGLVMSSLLALRDHGVRVAGGAGLCGWYDLALDSPATERLRDIDPVLNVEELAFAARAYLGELPTNDPRISTIHADLAGLPPLFLSAADRDVLLDDTTRLAAAAGAAGVEVQHEIIANGCHGIHGFAPEVREARDAMVRLGSWINERLGQSPPSA